VTSGWAGFGVGGGGPGVIEVCPSGSFRGVVRSPGSKSITNRALLLAGLASGESRVRGALLDAEDAERMCAALRALGAGVEASSGDLLVRGVGGRWCARGETRLDLRNSGTATRFLAASGLLARGPIVVDGNARMRQRPIGELGEALAGLGAVVEYEGGAGLPPMRVTPPAGGPAEAGREARFGRAASSQFISALLLVAPFLPGGMTVRVEEPTSPSYVRLTLSMLRSLGVLAESTPDLSFLRVVSRGVSGGLSGFDLTVEPDASGATYFAAAAALVPGARVTLVGLGPRSVQGDSQFPLLLERMGAVVGVDGDGCWTVRGGPRLGAVIADMRDMPDAVMTLASCCAFADGRSVLMGVRTLRDKECDRISAMRAEFAKIGVRVVENLQGDPDAMAVEPPLDGDGRNALVSSGGGEVMFDTYDDHRMAMSLALVGLRRPGVFVRDPGCVAKTYPRFFEDLASLTGASGAG